MQFILFDQVVKFVDQGCDDVGFCVDQLGEVWFVLGLYYFFVGCGKGVFDLFVQIDVIGDQYDLGIGYCVQDFVGEYDYC